MLHTLAIANYRSLKALTVPLGRLNVVTGPNGSGKSSLYHGLRLLSQTAFGASIESLAAEGGIESALWAGPEQLAASVKRGDHPVQGGPRQAPVHLRFGFAGEDFGYTQVWVTSHAASLVDALALDDDANHVELGKDFGETRVVGFGPLDSPAWRWPAR